MAVSNESEREPTARLVILGASNVARGISTIVEAARLQNGRTPLELFAAIGHGRSFGLTTRVAGRTIPAILDCRLWEELARRTATTPLPTAALVTDIGNDILYGVEPRRIATWVERCVVMLMERRATVAVTRLPMESILSLGEMRFAIARRLLFPRSTLDLHTAVERAAELDERMVGVTRALGVTLVGHDGRWYGLDPIHIRMKHWRQAWPAFLGATSSCWSGLPGVAAKSDATPVTTSLRPSVSRWARLRLLVPDIRWVCGIEQRRRQPGLTLADGTSIWAY